MIQISAAQKGAPPAKLMEAAKQAAAWLVEYNQFASSGLSADKIAENQAKFLKELEISSDSYAPPAVKEQLVTCHHGKCAYCETRIIHNHYGDVEHFRPKKGVTFYDKTGKMATIPDAYFWRAFDLANLFLSCGVCNEQYKKNYFGLLPDLTPTDAERTYVGVGPLQKKPIAERRQSPAHPNLVEHAVLIDPGLDDPRLLLYFNPETGEALPSPHIQLVGGDKDLAFARTHKTIEVMGLNRPALLAERKLHLQGLNLLLMPILNDLHGLVAFAKFGALIEQKKLPTPPRSDPYAGALAQAAAAVKQQRSGTAAALAFDRLVESIQPWAEYSALALDAVTRWSVVEYMKLSAAQSVQATTQASAGSAQIGATHTLAPRVPEMLLKTLANQIPDYRQVVTLYCKHRWAASAEDKDEQTELRRQLHGEMNALINDYEYRWKAFSQRITEFSTQEGMLRHNFLKEEVENYQADLARGIEDAADEPHLLDCLQNVDKALTPVFAQMLASKDIDQAKALNAHHRKLLVTEIPAFYVQRIQIANTQHASTKSMTHWQKQHGFFMERLDHTLGAAPLDKFRKDFLELTEDDFMDLYERLTDLIVRYRLGDLYNKTSSSRADPLKEGIQEMLVQIRTLGAGKPLAKIAAMKRLTAISIR
ncbi:hypothetical protein DRW03_10120 [Corallococcus sp. H22C18031201]|uniref:hypothetical protein n=1 Tax=Citreicoccus inhibens TaxID=2849499 RepID=UPI000E73CC81|nr:hypothetical protein [Citreicoccus inhibens]MBU8899357.1 hypothetical protein [Citreicoccus inhibens]RJS23967.1 hypothetical protein DRW03_10120 [Corallococcus sp. H22C18031201]